jgi:predicted SAM-dependent methyltransferase
MKVLNLGCGTKVSNDPSVVNIDWSVMLRIRRNPLLRAAVPILLKGERLLQFRQLGDNIMVHDLSKGIPFPDGSVDAVYHSHTLEHLDRDIVPGVFAEIRRVLKTGGIQRIVVPDLEMLGRAYVAHLDACAAGSGDIREHDVRVASILEQCVRKEASGTSQQAPFRRYVENLLLGDARQRGHTHQWMWDRFNLQAALEAAGFGGVSVESHRSSGIPQWHSYGLDTDAQGKEYKAGSLYVEARKLA